MQPGRNDPCPCGSGRKYKHCCGAMSAPPQPAVQEIDALVALVKAQRLGEAEQRTRALLATYPGAGMLWKILSVALERQGKEALSVLQQAAQLLPHDAEAHRNLGATLYDRGEWAAALASLQRSLELQPNALQTLIDAGNAQRALGRPGESVALYQRALQLEPGAREAQNNLGNAFLELGQCEAAVRCYRAALESQPHDAQVLCNLGNALRQLARFEEAIACSQRALALEPGLAMAHNNLGLSLAGSGRRREAVASYRQAVNLSPHYVEALSNLGNALRELGDPRAALSIHHKAAAIAPQRADCEVDLGNTLYELWRTDEAAACFRRAIALQPALLPAERGLAAALRMQGRNAEARESCRAVLAREPNHAGTLTLLGELHADRGDFAAAQELFERSLALDSGLAAAFIGIAAHRRMTASDSSWHEAVKALLATPLPLAQEIGLHYALGKYFDDLGQYGQAFGHYRDANELSKRCDAPYDRSKLAQRVSRIIDSFDAAFIRRCQAHACDSDAGVFIIGMPRSGTSLTEQILASHQAVFGAGELRFWDHPFTELERAGLGSEAAAQLVPRIGQDYLERVTALSGGAVRVTDKMPANFLYAGLIHAVFPRARIIHMQRHPLDTCLSIYFQNLVNLGPYANDLESLAHYYGEYLRIMAHWRAVLPATALLEVPYEGLIADQEGWTRRMLEFIGLPWDPRCLDFQQTERAIITASRWQVRQKIHSGSVGRWRNYQSHLAPLEHLVALCGATSALSAVDGPGGALVPVRETAAS